jgi:hypothetical protein
MTHCLLFVSERNYNKLAAHYPSMFLASHPAPKQGSAYRIWATKYHNSGSVISYILWDNRMTASFQTLVYSPMTITSYHVIYY